MSNSTGYAGDQLGFTIISDVYATFEVLAENQTIMRGDTLSRREYSFVIPPARNLRIAALAQNCGARLRATRTITVLEQPKMIDDTVNSSAIDGANEIATPSAPQTQSASLPVAQIDNPTEETENTTPSSSPPPIATGAVVLDTDRSMVPWISAFGIVTLVVSVFVFSRFAHEHK